MKKRIKLVPIFTLAFIIAFLLFSAVSCTNESKESKKLTQNCHTVQEITDNKSTNEMIYLIKYDNSTDWVFIISLCEVKGVDLLRNHNI